MDSNAIAKLSYGLYVLGVKTDNGFGGQIIDCVAQVSGAERPNIVVSSNKNNYSNEMIKKYGELTLSVLGVDFDPFVIGNFGFQCGRDVEKWGNVPHSMVDNLPVLDAAVAHLRLKVVDLKELSTHTMFITETVDAWNGKSSAKPLIYDDYKTKYKDAVFAAFKKYKGECEI